MRSCALVRKSCARRPPSHRVTRSTFRWPTDNSALGSSERAADLRGRLTSVGYSVTAIAASGNEALRLIRQTSPDLVLMDIRIKGNQDGIQIAQRVYDEFDIPVVYLTAYEDRGTLERAAATNQPV